MGKERLVTFARYSWHLGMQLLHDVIAHTLSHLRVSKRRCVVVFCAVDLVRMVGFFHCQCTLKSTGQRRSGELVPASPRWTCGRSFPSRPSPDSLALREGSPQLRRISLAGGAPHQTPLAVGCNKGTCRSLLGDLRKHHSCVRSPRSPLPASVVAPCTPSDWPPSQVLSSAPSQQP